MDYAKIAEQITCWMREFAANAKTAGYVVGLSGGVDSAVSAALAVRAVGVENVLGVIMPCHSMPEDAAYAESLAQALGLTPLTLDLGPAFDALTALLPPGNAMARANLKPRLRMLTLYYMAQSRNALVAGTGNYPEIMVGYFTKYGDGGVDIEPLGELYKHEVRELARYLNVPEPIITRAPTAGLWPGQTDESEMGLTYDQLDGILAALAAGQVPAAPEGAVAKVQRMIAGAAHKRATPPICPITRA